MNTHLFRAACAAAAVATILTAQTRLYQIDGDSPGDRFGRSVHDAGDVNGDGTPDFIVGAPTDDDNGTDCGSAVVYSGLDGSVIHRFVGAQTNYRLGTSVAGAGDVNGDGFADVVVGSIGDDHGATAFGSARVFSGADGSQLHEWFGAREFNFFGQCVRAAGDINADGYDDVIVGVTPLLGSGNAFVYSGRDGTLLQQFLVLGTGEMVDGAGDVNGDGYADVVVGRPNDDTAGLVAGTAAAWSGKDRTLLWQVQGLPFEQLGTAVAAVGDVNRDGFDDVAVGATQVLSGGPGYVRVISGADGSTLYTLTGIAAPDQFGTSVAGVSDVDGDGVGDIVVGAPSEDANGIDSGAVRIFSGSTGTLLMVIPGDSAGDRFGNAVSLIEDVNDDGFAELIVGAPDDDDAGAEAGRVFLIDLGFVSQPGQEVLAPGRESHYGHGCAGSDGRLPRVDHRGDSAAGATLEVRLRGAIPLTGAVLFMGDAINYPLDSLGAVNCTVFADPAGFAIFQPVDGDGLARATIPVPAGLGTIAGIEWSMQWIVVDIPANPLGLVVSDALLVRFGD